MTDAISTLLHELAALDRAYSPGHHGLWSARKRTTLIDTALIQLFGSGAPPSGTAIAALGGYGRARQFPFSDIDLLILHDGTDAEGVGGLTDHLLYPLWDAGFEIGQAVRTPAECFDAARERFDVLTAMLDARYLAGDEEILDAALEPVRRLASGDVDAFVERLREAVERRSERFGSAAHLLEPDLKEGSGGLRDIASFGWLEAGLGTSLEAAAVFRASERVALEEAEEFLTRARGGVHLHRGKRSDRLTSDLQEDVARDMGFADEPLLPAPDGLMRAVFEHARSVAYIRDQVFARIDGPARPASAAPAAFDVRSAEDVLSSLLVIAESGSGDPPMALLDAVENADLPDPIVWTAGMRSRFMSLLRLGGPGAAMLDTLDRLDVLRRFLPAWAAVRCRPQRDPYHRFTVDTHLTEALTGMARMLADGAGLDPGDAFESGVVDAVPDRDALLLGALFHDIGKNGGGNHVPVGSQVARDTLMAMGVPAATRNLATFMVAEHLLLPDTATRRDLTDENLVLDVAARIATPERLAALYLLAKADALATGPAAWTPWRQALVRELAMRVQRVFDRGEMGSELAERLSDRISLVRALLTNEPLDIVERFLARMPRGYFLAVEPVRAARHFATIAPEIGAHEARTAAVPGAREGSYELLVVAADHPGLLSQIAGSLALAGLSVLSAQVFTTDDHVAVDLFEVEGAFETEIGEERWREFRGTLRKAIDGRLSLGHRVAEKRRHYPANAGRAPVTVTVDNQASDFYTVVEVGAPDRIGLLFDITSALAEAGLDVHVAKVATYTGRVIDAFYIRNADGTKVTDPAVIQQIEAALRTLN